MLDELKTNFTRLISLYEKEKQRSEELSGLLAASKASEESCKKQLSEMESQIENLKLAQAFAGTADKSSRASEMIDKLIKEIDKCISMIEK